MGSLPPKLNTRIADTVAERWREPRNPEHAHHQLSHIWVPASGCPRSAWSQIHREGAAWFLSPHHHGQAGPRRM